MEDQDNLASTEEQNVELVYKYIEHSLQATSDSINRLGTRITTLVGFSGLLLRFTIDLPQNIVVQDLDAGPMFKVTIVGTLALAVVVSVWGLLPKPSGEAYTASELLDELKGRDRCYSMQYITLSRDETLKGLDKLRLLRVTCLRWTTFLTVFSTLLFAADIILSTAT